MNPKQIMLAALDLDGTLLDRNDQISPFTLDTIRRIQASGKTVAICTGRFPENVSILLSDAGIECPVISLNGCVIQEKVYGEKIVNHYLSKALVQQVVDVLESIRASYFIFGDKLVLTRKEDYHHHSHTIYGERMYNEAGVLYLYGKEQIDASISKPMHKFYVYEDQTSCTLSQARQAVSLIEGIEITQSSDRNFEIMPKGIDKWSGLSFLIDRYQLSSDQVMAVGDQENDLPMIQNAGIGVAMGNANDNVKAAADDVTDDHHMNGAAAALVRYMLD